MQCPICDVFLKIEDIGQHFIIKHPNKAQISQTDVYPNQENYILPGGYSNPQIKSNFESSQSIIVQFTQTMTVQLYFLPTDNNYLNKIFSNCQNHDIVVNPCQNSNQIICVVSNLFAVFLDLSDNIGFQIFFRLLNDSSRIWGIGNDVLNLFSNYQVIMSKFSFKIQSTTLNELCNKNDFYQFYMTFRNQNPIFFQKMEEIQSIRTNHTKENLINHCILPIIYFEFILQTNSNFQNMTMYQNNTMMNNPMIQNGQFMSNNQMMNNWQMMNNPMFQNNNTMFANNNPMMGNMMMPNGQMMGNMVPNNPMASPVSININYPAASPGMNQFSYQAQPNMYIQNGMNQQVLPNQFQQPIFPNPIQTAQQLINSSPQLVQQQTLNSNMLNSSSGTNMSQNPSFMNPILPNLSFNPPISNQLSNNSSVQNHPMTTPPSSSGGIPPPPIFDNFSSRQMNPMQNQFPSNFSHDSKIILNPNNMNPNNNDPISKNNNAESCTSSDYEPNKSQTMIKSKTPNGKTSLAISSEMQNIDRKNTSSDSDQNFTHNQSSQNLTSPTFTSTTTTSNKSNFSTSDESDAFKSSSHGQSNTKKYASSINMSSDMSNANGALRADFSPQQHFPSEGALASSSETNSDFLSSNDHVLNKSSQNRNQQQHYAVKLKQQVKKNQQMNQNQMNFNQQMYSNPQNLEMPGTGPQPQQMNKYYIAVEERRNRPFKVLFNFDEIDRMVCTKLETPISDSSSSSQYSSSGDSSHSQSTSSSEGSGIDATRKYNEFTTHSDEFNASFNNYHNPPNAFSNHMNNAINRGIFGSNHQPEIGQNLQMSHMMNMQNGFPIHQTFNFSSEGQKNTQISQPRNQPRTSVNSPPGFNGQVFHRS
ncbi:hypothetical protein TRFO_22080 [Tritrichomonas foetus]|uniref:Uncharacterized protein n=1 Tax=Tritrichomonas foetus TaxID=1144522 RepID=A0A1J4KCK9_9EUKA|nr:hypothetical protein TRFO_22080 [Tritrichomonas foetus]|eukprot:OHT09159.1 hypothetical protein TRFO_22080 [Tritrichomonas foetus]